MFHVRFHRIRFRPLLLLHLVKSADEIPYPDLLFCQLRRYVPVVKRILPHPLCLLPESADGIPALYFGAVVPVLACVLLHDTLEFFHPVPVLVQLVLHSVQKP